MSKKKMTTNEANKTLINYALLDHDHLKIEFLEKCGHHLAGEVKTVPFAAARQYIAGGFAAVYFDEESNIEGEV